LLSTYFRTRQRDESKLGRILHRPSNIEWLEGYRVRMESKEGRVKISKRRGIGKHPFGTIKTWMGKIPLLLRGRRKVSTEIDLYSTCYNLRRLLTISSFDVIISQVVGYNWLSA